jgi:hypothetical protein
MYIPEMTEKSEYNDIIPILEKKSYLSSESDKLNLIKGLMRLNHFRQLAPSESLH